MAKHHVDFLRRCIDEKVSQQITLRYSTNLTILPEELIEVWRFFKKVRVGASIDGVERVNDYIRYPSSWEKVNKNLDRLLNCEHVYVWVQPCATIYNVFYFPEIFQWGRTKMQRFHGASTSLNIHPHLVHYPKLVNIQNLPKSLILELEVKFSKFKGLPHEEEFLRGLISYALKENTERSMKAFGFTPKALMSVDQSTSKSH